MNKKKETHTYKKEKGQSLVELAFSLTVIMLLLAGAVDLSLALFTYVSMRDAAQEGALYGSISLGGTGSCPSITQSDIDQIRLRVISAASDVVQLQPAEITVAVTGCACEGTTGGVPNSVKVSIVHDHHIMMAFSNLIFPGQKISLRAFVTDTILSPICP